MPPKKPLADDEKIKRFYEEIRRERMERQKGYRDRALSILPHACARCSREFEGKKLLELTVHHKDHNHENNPPDGSNWELLCMYCHEDEHAREISTQSGMPTPRPVTNPQRHLRSSSRLPVLMTF